MRSPARERKWSNKYGSCDQERREKDQATAGEAGVPKRQSH